MIPTAFPMHAKTGVSGKPPEGATVEQPGFWSLIRRYMILMLLCAVVGAGFGAFIQLRDSSGYVATIRVFSNSKQSSNVAISQSTSLAVQRMGSYVRLVNSTRTAERLIARLSLSSSPESVSNRVSAALDKDTVNMSVSVTAATPAEAKSTVDVLPAEFTALVHQLTNLSATDPNSTVFTVVDGPFVRKNASVTRLALSTFFGVVMGVAIGLAIVHVLIRRFVGRTMESSVGMTGAPVVGIVPGADARPVKSHPDAGDARRLAHHHLARNLTHLTKPQHRLVVVCSAADMPHSAPITLGLATALAQRGQRVLFVDTSFVSGRTQVETESKPSADASLMVVNGQIPLATAVGKTTISQPQPVGPR